MTSKLFSANSSWIQGQAAGSMQASVSEQRETPTPPQRLKGCDACQFLPAKHLLNTSFNGPDRG